jgi:type IX secretion system PorP/SprF family membrane protein
VKRLILYLILIIQFDGFSQDIHFSQTTRANFQINPAFTGCFDGDIKAEMNFKDQWQSIDKTFRTYASSFEYAFGRNSYKTRNAEFAVGAHIFKDVAGDIELGNTTAGASLSSLIKVNRKTRLVLGLQANYTSSGINPNNLQWGSQYNGLNYDPSLSNNEGLEYRQSTFLDIGTGVALWYHKKDGRLIANSPQNAKIGLSVFHVNKPVYTLNNSFDSRLPMRFVLHGDMTFAIHEDLYFYPNFNVNFQNKQHEILIGSMFKYRLKSASKITGFSKEWTASAGLDLRITNLLDAVIPQIYIGIEDFSLGLSYDINVSKLNYASYYRGGFEISIRYIHSNRSVHRKSF